MAKRALCIGINDYPFGEEDDLRGCVNDAVAWRRLLLDHYDFASTDIRLLRDKEATRNAFLREFKTVLAKSTRGDVVVFTNSSHGTYAVDTESDEPDGYDEAICPYDARTSLVLDDDLRSIIAEMKDGIRLIVISDSCHSGTMTRELHARKEPRTKYRRSRFLSPATRGAREVPNPGTRSLRAKERFPESAMRELLLAGCSARQSSYDDLFGDTFHGALTHYALEAIRKAKYKITWEQLAKRVTAQLDANEYDQSPQLEGKDDFKPRQIFT